MSKLAFSKCIVGATLLFFNSIVCLPATAQTVESGPGANGLTVKRVTYGVGQRFRLEKPKQWVEESERGERNVFAEEKRDSTAVTLYDAGRNLRLRLDLQRPQVMLVEGSKLSPLYDIVSFSTSASPTATVTTNIPSRYLGDWATDDGACRVSASVLTISASGIRFGATTLAFVSGTETDSEFRMKANAQAAEQGKAASGRDVLLAVLDGGLRFLSAVGGKETERRAFVRCEKADLQSSQVSTNPPAKSDAPKVIAYGNRKGMVVDIVSATGLNSSAAIITVRHTRNNAKTFCLEFRSDKSEKCIDETMREVKVPEKIVANCVTGELSTLLGDHVVFHGRNPKASPTNFNEPGFIIKRGNSVLAEAAVSGYDMAIEQFTALCPDRVRAR